MSTIVIVGANQGIGFYLAQSLLRMNHSVAVLDIKLHNLEKLRAHYPERLLPILADSQDLESIQQGVALVHEKWGDLDVAIHNACLCTFDSEPERTTTPIRKLWISTFLGPCGLPKRCCR
ncbi:SDR family NAD(P)-dependent oxidoreductase [Mobiluncus porci]|uniref:SDR family NAD(P)-dependent oxidoreductase n=1 Tax=Mobiluncus porci TaxID=2652278 RepID=UPI00227C183C|nr:SDR family NAD(P)-dependent oxidoreductase [Mobiluncus porci]